MYEIVATTGPGVMLGHVVTDFLGVMQIVNGLNDRNVTVMICRVSDDTEAETLH
jgi:hypothetical protein